MPVSVRSAYGRDFQVRLRGVAVGGIQISMLDYPPMEAHRTPRMIRRSDPEAYVLGLNIKGAAEVRRGTASVSLSESDMTLHDSSHPSSTYTDRGRGMTVLIPRSLLPLPESHLNRLFLKRLSGRDGIGRLAAGYLLELARGAETYRPSDTSRLSTVTLDLLAAMFAHHLEAERTLPPETARKAMLARVHAFIDRRLADPELSPETVARAHNLSVRSLQRLFEAHQGTTVSAWIRDRRLDRSRRDLADPLLRDRPVYSIAARWGFTAAHFTRLFRAAYGVTPTDYRRMVHEKPR